MFSNKTVVISHQIEENRKCVRYWVEKVAHYGAVLARFEIFSKCNNYEVPGYYTKVSCGHGGAIFICMYTVELLTPLGQIKAARCPHFRVCWYV